MKRIPGAELSERLQAAAEARKALLSQLRPKPAVAASVAPDRAGRRAADRQRLRQARQGLKAEKAKAALARAEAAQGEADASAAAALALKRGERAQRKTTSKAEQKARRDARYAARKARQ